MNPKKSGTVFIVLMIALIAFGVASAANVANVGTDIIGGVIPSNITLSGSDKITAIGDPTFKPVYINKRVIVNLTNNTTIAPVNTSNRTNVTNSG